MPVDEPPLAEAALVPAAHLTAALAAPAHGTLHLLEVLDPSYSGTERGERALEDRDTRQAAREDAEHYLSGGAKRIGEADLTSRILSPDYLTERTAATCWTARCSART